MRYSVRAQSFILGSLAAIAALTYYPPEVWCQNVQPPTSAAIFPAEHFLPVAPTLTNDKLNFTDDEHNSCCSTDYKADGTPLPNRPAQAANAVGSVNPGLALIKTEFDRLNPGHVASGPPNIPVSCNRFTDLPVYVSNGNFPVKPTGEALPISAYSTNVSRRAGATFATETDKHNTSDFHIEVSGGDSRIALQDVNSYSVCMARGRNELAVGNTDNASIMAYAGDDRVLLAGNNTNMFTRTGDGEDIVELIQAEGLNQGDSRSSATQWKAYQIYKTAISGGDGNDRLIFRETPFGTKWCYIGVYKIYGETFHVVEFALPPTVTSGPRRQRVNIGSSVEFITIKGKTYTLVDFLSHGAPVDAVARSTPIHGDLPPSVGNL